MAIITFGTKWSFNTARDLQFPFIMALIQINSEADRLSLHQDPGADPRLVLRHKIGLLPIGAPIIILVHGFKYSPFLSLTDPHRSIFSLESQKEHWKSRSWPLALGFSDGFHDGLCIGFGWDGVGRRSNLITSFRDVYQRAGHAGRRLGELIRLIGDIAPERKVDVMTHSVGARVLFKSLSTLEHTNLGRVILLGAAEFQKTAERSIENEAGQNAMFYNVTSAENRFYELLFENFGPRSVGGKRALSRGGLTGLNNWSDIPIDNLNFLETLTEFGLKVSHPQRYVCHWSFYLRPGVFSLYRAILRDRKGWCSTTLRSMTHENALLPAADYRPEPGFSTAG